MRLKMLIGLSGNDFVLDPGDVTERFEDKEAKRLISNGYAEKAPPVEKKKPETKQEWDEERAALIAENEQLKEQAVLSADREALYVSELEKLSSFKKLVSEGLLDLEISEPKGDGTGGTP